MTTVPDHLIDKALAAGVRARAERAVALDRALAAAVLAAVANRRDRASYGYDAHLWEYRDKVCTNPYRKETDR